MARIKDAGAAPPRRGRRAPDRARPRKYTRINSEAVDYKDLNLLRRFLSDKGKTRGRRVTGLSRKHQRQLSELLELLLADERQGWRLCDSTWSRDPGAQGPGSHAELLARAPVGSLARSRRSLHDRG